jgi:hypothetical protein
MISEHSKWWIKGSLIALLGGLVTAPAIAQTANFGTFTLTADKPSVVVTGATGGSASLPAIVSNSDRRRNKCLGFGDPKPDHIMVLQNPFATLKLKVNNGNTDNTLIVVGPKDEVRCGDARLEDDDWQPGTYQVWVGSGSAGNRKDYRLSVQGNK